VVVFGARTRRGVGGFPLTEQCIVEFTDLIAQAIANAEACSELAGVAHVSSSSPTRPAGGLSATRR
jgi:hypothetical protein